MTPTQHLALHAVLRDVAAERHRQHQARGEQNLERDYPTFFTAHLRDVLRTARDWQAAGDATWDVVLLEEVAEALLCDFDNDTDLRAELIQVAAVAVQWIEALDRKQATGEAA